MEIERYAALRAEMDTGALRDDVLARAGLSVDEWVGVQRDWLEKMGDELSRGRRELTNQYTKAFLERQRALAGAKEREPSPRVETVPPQAPLPPMPLPPMPLPQAPLPPPPAAPIPAMVAPAGETAPLPPIAPPPIAPPPIAPPVLIQAPLSAPSINATSSNVISPFAAASALPFAPEAGPAQSALPAPKPPPPKPPPPKPPPPKPPPSSPGEAPSELTGTVAATRMSPFASALPFAKAPPPPPSRPDSASSASMPIPPVAKPPPPPKAPPPPPAAAPLPSLTVEQHASLCAELAFMPTRADEILGRYRVTTEGKARFDQVMRERFAENPTLQSRWQEAYQVYYAFLRGATAKQRPKDG